MALKHNPLTDKLNQMRREGEERDAKRRAEKAKLDYLDLRSSPINIEALSLITEEKAREAKIAAIEEKNKKLALVVFDPTQKETQLIVSDLKSKGYETIIHVVSLSGLNHVWNSYKFVTKGQEKITGSVQIEEKELADFKNRLTSLESVQKLINEFNKEGGSTSKLLEVILAGALANRASDIHLEPEEKNVKFRLRIDGLLHSVSDATHNVYLYILSRIKLISELKLNVHDQAQDGRFSIKLPEKEIEVRVAIAPAEFGEVVVMRLLDPDMINISLSELGLREDDLSIIETALKQPNGLILNTGPTGSGKSTTLYAFLKHVRTSEIKIITIEDPIEYHLDGIEQTQVDEESGYNFANGLRSMMRQDPDVILVGEIRDKDTAEIGIQAALTGHLVFSTVHANEAAGAVPRLVDLGVRTSSIGPALNLIIAQRLVRRLCLNCKKPGEIDDNTKEKIEKIIKNFPDRVKKENYKEFKIFKAVGCEKCNNFGYKGRVAIYELLTVGPEMEELINKETSEVKINEFAKKQGMTTLQEDGILKTITGVTTFDEVESVTGPIDWNS